MKEKILTNVRIIDPSQQMDEGGNIIIDKNGKIKIMGESKTKPILARYVSKIY